MRASIAALIVVVATGGCFGEKGIEESAGDLALALDRALGLSAVDVQARLLTRANAAGVRQARLALLAGDGGGVRAELRVGERTLLGMMSRRSDWGPLLDTMLRAHSLAEKTGADAEAIAKLCASSLAVEQIAGSGLLAHADHRAFDAILRRLGPEAPPGEIRHTASVFINTPGREATIHLIELSQRYPELLEELLGAVAERDESVAVAYLTAVAAGHDELGARQTARAALQMRQR